MGRGEKDAGLSAVSVLHEIAAKVAVRLAARQEKVPFGELQMRLRSLPQRPRVDVLAGLRQPGIHVIAEVKRASPSQKDIARDADPLQVAREYVNAGAFALSVLTEQDYFNGEPKFLQDIRKQHPEARLLMKDFMLEPYQIWEAKVLGADMILLIVALLGKEKTRELHEMAKALGMTSLVEVHDAAELKIAVDIPDCLIGINNRNLKTLEIDLNTTRTLVPLIPKNRLFITESGLSRGEELQEFRRAGCCGFLIGSSLMKTGKPGEALKNLIKDASNAG